MIPIIRMIEFINFLRYGYSIAVIFICQGLLYIPVSSEETASWQDHCQSPEKGEAEAGMTGAGRAGLAAAAEVVPAGSVPGGSVPEALPVPVGMAGEASGPWVV